MNGMSRRFSDLLSRAIAGDHDAVEEILEMYMPLINHHSRIYGYIDEDCRQYIMMRIALSIQKFTI
jgi:hypothetical protein